MGTRMGDVDPGVARANTGICMRTHMDKVDLGEARADTRISLGTRRDDVISLLAIERVSFLSAQTRISFGILDALCNCNRC